MLTLIDDVQNIIVRYLSLLEYNQTTNISLLLYLQLRAQYYYLPQIQDYYSRMIVNQQEYKILTNIKYRFQSGTTWTL